MIKKLSKHGNNLALIIDKPILELLNINETTKLTIQTDGNRLILEPLKETERTEIPTLEEIIEELTQLYSHDLKKLADS